MEAYAHTAKCERTCTGRAARRHRGLSQDELARQAGIARRTLSRISNGNVSGEIGLILSVVRALELSLDPAEHSAGEFTLDTFDEMTDEL
ncbi:helix-turn-helix transcriptional regulator [Isoptericola halotolerans]|uniref:helix-turn-helix transcriptional regulator n=1 Tax=Isoptericola halotolerans TaxID=300560 RepID=UPI00388F0F33